MTAVQKQLDRTAIQVEDYIEKRFFSPYGVMYAYIDSHTGKPFARKFIAPDDVPRRAAFDPWSYWTYEDTVCTMGHYIEGLAHQFAVTGDATLLERARKQWHKARDFYSASQVCGDGNFLRLYGSYENMFRFLEPLGTDQASPLFSGLYFYSKHAEAETREEIADIMLKTLAWYERQGFCYFYYKSFFVPWGVDCQHGASFFLPAIALAAKRTREKKWRDLLKAKLALFKDPRYQLYRWGQGSFCWGSDLVVLRELLGKEFSTWFPRSMLESSYRRCLEDLKRYNESGMSYRLCPESKKPGFKPYMFPMRPPYERDLGMGYSYFYTVHQGRQYPRHEMHFLCGLAGLKFPGAMEQAKKLLAVYQDVPRDFTNMVADDYDELPKSVHIYARMTGTLQTEWFRNYWLLRRVEAGKL